MRSYEPEGYICRCGQKNWPLTQCTRCGCYGDPQQAQYDAWNKGGRC